MFKCSMNHRPGWSTAILAGVIAGTSATLVQVLLWLVSTDAFPAILFRDARLTAAPVARGPGTAGNLRPRMS